MDRRFAGIQYSSEMKVANPPERAKDDSSVGARNGQLSRTGSLTVLRRTNSRKTGSTSSRASSVSMDSLDSYASLDLGTDKLPGADTTEATHMCSVRLRMIARRLEKDDITKKDLKRNLEYAASVLETVYIDETSTHECVITYMHSISQWFYQMDIQNFPEFLMVV
ncbi:hypothetical protein ACOMHN_049508 [Nucella lapillus]